ncbi:integrase [Bradyrhizobium sp. USDA 4369]
MVGEIISESWATSIGIRRLPQALAGKDAPPHIRAGFPDLVNATTGKFKHEFVQSLDTKEAAGAKRQAHRIALRLTARIDEASQAIATPPTPTSAKTVNAKEVGEAVYRRLLADDETERLLGDDRRLIGVDRAELWPHLEPLQPASGLGMQPDHAAVYEEETAELAKEYRTAYARRDASIVFAETAIEMKKRGAAVDRSSSEFQAVAIEVLAAHVRAYGAILKRHEGEDLPTPAEPIPQARGPLLSEAFAQWQAGGGSVRGSKKPSENTVIEARQAVRFFTELHGDMRVADITKRTAREFRDAIAKVPKNLPEALRKLLLPKLLERDDLSKYPARGATTINKAVQLLGAIVSHAESEGALDEVEGFVNPFGKAVKFKVDDGETEEREIFSKADLKIIFASPVYTERRRSEGGKGEAAFWLPLIGLFSGMRLNEIARLRIIDLRQDDDDGVWFFDVSRSGGRSTKTVSSIRRVPVHPELKRIGLLTYRSWLLDAGARLDGPLWPGLKAPAWSKWINGYLRNECGIGEATKVFHSFRHTFKRMTRDAGLYEELHDAITGHANKDSVGRDYGKGFSIKPLTKAMAQIEAPVDLSGLAWRVP